MNNNVGVVEVMDFESMVLSSSTKKRKILQNNYEGLLKPVSQENNQNDVLSLFGSTWERIELFSHLFFKTRPMQWKPIDEA